MLQLRLLERALTIWLDVKTWIKGDTGQINLKCYTCLGIVWEEGIQMFREIGMSEWICHIRLTHPPGRVQRTYLLPILWELNLWQKPQHPLRALGSLFSENPKLQWELLPLNAMENLMQWKSLDPGVAGPNGGIHWQRHDRDSYPSRQQSQSSNQSNLAHKDLCC